MLAINVIRLVTLQIQVIVVMKVRNTKKNPDYHTENKERYDNSVFH